MEKYIGNYLRQANKDFPTACETLDYLAKNQAMAEMLGAVAGDKVILSGCVYDETLMTRTEGYVFVKSQDYPQGEVLHFAGDNGGNTNVHVSSEDVSVVANGYNYTKAYTKRTLAPGYGTEQYNWADFSLLHNCNDLYAALTSLQDAFDNLVSEPLGIVKMYAGSSLPANYAYCEGQSLDRTEYAELFAAIGTRFGSDSDNTFRLPNLKGMFVVGYNADDPDYNALGKTGGENNVTLKQTEIPSHSHNFVWSDKSTFNVPQGGNGGDTGCSGSASSLGNASFNSMVHVNGTGNWDTAKAQLLLSINKETGTTGGGQAHENRPPYFTLAYIIKIK